MEKELRKNTDFVKRPVAVLTLSFFISFCVAATFHVFEKNIFLWASGALFCLVCPFCIVISMRKAARLKRLSVFLGYVSLVLCGVFVSLGFYHSVFPLDEVSRYKDRDVYLEFTVTKVAYKSPLYSTYVAKVHGANGAPESFTVVIDTASELEIGDVARAVAHLYEPESDGDFNEKRYCLSAGAALRGEASDAVVAGHDESFGIKLEVLREKISAAITSEMSQESGGVLKAVFLGNKSDLSAKVKRDFARLGISHLAAISGMHVSFLCTALFALSKKLRIGKRWGAFLSVFLVMLYTALTGFSPSTVRAAVVCCISSFIMIIGISYDGATALGVCGAGMLIANPFSAFDQGFLLSFSAFAGCIAATSLTGRIFKKQDPKKKGFIFKCFRDAASSLIFTVTIVLFTLPVTWLYYDSTSVLAPLSNLIFIPLFSVMMYIGIILTALHPIAPLFGLLSAAADGYVRLVLLLVEKAASLRNITVSLSYNFAPVIIFAAAFCCVALCTVRNRKASFAFGLCLVLCVASYGAGILIHGASLRGKVTVSRTGYYNGDSVIVASGGKSALADVSDGRFSRLSDIKGEMARLSETELDCLIITNYTKYRAEYLSKLAGSVFIGKVYLPSPASEDEARIRDELIETLRSMEVEWETLPDKVKIGEAEIVFYENKYVREDDEPVVGFKVRGKSESLVYLGSGWNSVYGEKEFYEEGAGCLSAIIGSYGPDMTRAVSPAQIENFDRIYMFSSDFEKIKNLIYAFDENSLYDSSLRISVILD